MKRWLCILTIAGYLGALGYGLTCHSLQSRQTRHPAMYFVVWDMFCGWSAYSIRSHVIAEGESGRYYELAPGPWADYHPYADLSRHHYDAFGNHFSRLATNTLAHTSHEPMTRILVVQEMWNKKFNLPDDLWNQMYSEPKEEHHYYHLQYSYSPDGELTGASPSWLAMQQSWSLSDNPRLQRQSRQGQPLYAIKPGNRYQSNQLGGFVGATTQQMPVDRMPAQSMNNVSPLGN